VHRLGRIVVVVTLVSAGVAAVATTSGAQYAPSSGATTPPPAPGDVGPGPATYPVGRRTIDVTTEPGRTVTVDVWYPADKDAVAGTPKSTYTFPGASYTSSVAYDSPPVSPHGPLPLVVYSHGSGGQRYVSGYLTEALAARGFVVAAADHTGNTAIDEFAKTRLPRDEILRIRPVDIKGEIDALTAASADPSSPFAGAVDPTRVGLVGHSAGGTGALMTVSGHDTVTADPRVRAVVGLAPWVAPASDAELAKVRVPVLIIGGTLDKTVPISAQTRAWKRIPGRPLYRVTLKNAGHQSFTDVCYYEDLVKVTPNAPAPLAKAIDAFAQEACTPRFVPITTAHRLIDRYAIGFLERYVAGDKSAARFLTPTEPKIVSEQTKR
jgi:predicted dienelactone hydrolase